MVTINIQKKDLWLISAVMVFLVGVGVVVAIGERASTHGHPQSEIDLPNCGEEGILRKNDNNVWACQKLDCVTRESGRINDDNGWAVGQEDWRVSCNAGEIATGGSCHIVTDREAGKIGGERVSHNCKPLSNGWNCHSVDHVCAQVFVKCCRYVSAN